MTIIPQPAQAQQQQYYVASPQQQYYIQGPQQVTRIVSYQEALHGQQRTIVVQAPPQAAQTRIMPSQNIRHIITHPQQQQTNIVRMTSVPRTPGQITVTQRPRVITPQVAPRPRISRPRIQRPGMTTQLVQRQRTPTVSQGMQHPSPQNVKLSYVTTPPTSIQRAVQPRPQQTYIQRGIPQNRVVLTRPQHPQQQRVVLHTTPQRFQSPPPPQIVTIKKTIQKSDDPDDIESNITAAIVTRKPDGTPIDPAEEHQQQQADIGHMAILKRQPTQQMRTPQMIKKVTGGQTPIISANAQKQEEESKERESAKMLVILQSGEQRLITFTLPKECCTVQELLEQVGVPFSADSNIQCISNPGKIFFSSQNMLDVVKSIFC